MTQEGYQVITILPIKSKMAAAKKQCFLRFLYCVFTSIIQSPQFTNDYEFGINLISNVWVHPANSQYIDYKTAVRAHSFAYRKAGQNSKVWLIFLCPKSFLQRFNFPSWHFWKTIIIGNQISSFVDKHATHLKRFSFQIV